MPDPTINPVTGEEETNPSQSNDSNQQVVIDKEQWDSLNAKLDAFDRPATPAAPPPPSGPSFEEQLSKIDSEIAAYDAKIDDAVANQEPFSKILRERDALAARKLRLQIQTEDVAPLRDVGLHTLDQLTDKVTRGEMPYYDIVQETFKQDLAGLSPELRANPEIRKKFYDAAVGKNIDKITSLQKEKLLRDVDSGDLITPGQKNSRQADAGDDVPKPEDILGKEAVRAAKSLGYADMDSFYRSKGYENWKDFYEQNKDFWED